MLYVHYKYITTGCPAVMECYGKLWKMIVNSWKFYNYSHRLLTVINTKNRTSFITVKAHCSITHLKQQKSLGFL